MYELENTMYEHPKTFAASPEAQRMEAEITELGDRIAELSAQITAATYHLLTMIREFDELDGWCSGFGGFRTCAHWLNWRIGLGMGAAREKVRVARALGELPKLSEAMRKGELSYSKIRALTRVATAENEDDLLYFGRAGTAAHVERFVRAWRQVDQYAELEQDKVRHESRYLHAYVDEDGMVVLRGRLEPETGAVLMRALEAASEALYRKQRKEEGESGEGASVPRVPMSQVPAAQQRADAIGLVAEIALAHGAKGGDGSMDPSPELSPVTRAERFQVVVHVDAEVLTDPSRPGVSVLEDGQSVPAETSRRLACDSSKVIMRHDAEGRILDVGRKTRTIHPGLRRALTYRDKICRFPACGVRHCEAHHLKHWADGGETSLENTLLLCRRHHRAVHEEGFTIERLDDGEIRFLRPDGSEVTMVPTLPWLCADPLKALATRAVDDGVSIDGKTGYPHWDGSPLDLGYAIEGLWRPRVPPVPDESSGGTRSCGDLADSSSGP